MSRKLKIAAAQLISRPADKKANLEKIKKYTKLAAEEGADFVVFPEMFYSGYDISKEQALELAEKQDGKLYKELSALARENNLYIICGYAELTENEQSTYISTMAVGRDGLFLGNHRKTYLSGGMEKENATPGDEYEVFDTEYGKMGMLICYEMEYPEPARILAFKGAEVIFVPAAFMNVHWMSRFLYAIAIHNQMYIVGVNHVGNRKGGCSKIISQMGLPMAEGSMTGEELVMAEIDLDSNVRRTQPHYYEFRPETLKKCYDAYQTNRDMLRGRFDPEDESLGYYREEDK